MNIENIENFSKKQCQELLDLMVLAMYSDGHLGSAEDARVQRLLERMGFDSEYGRSCQFDASVARVRKQSVKPDEIGESVKRIAASFISIEERRQAHEFLEQIMGGEGSASEEKRFLAVVKAAFQLG